MDAPATVQDWTPVAWYPSYNWCQLAALATTEADYCQPADSSGSYYLMAWR
ncbi:hypothetical protein ACFV1C_10560 [Streptomyces sp. NPDC059605]|uniref:hypothetical protein n=1 Tax=unclassified Streptomyces TaxID=2593676 RepID=UPI0036833D3F